MKQNALPLILLFSTLICIASECDPEREEEEPDPISEYDPAGRVSKDSVHIQWTTGEDIPYAQGWCAPLVISDQMYVFGGFNKVEGINRIIQCYDPGSDHWTVSETNMLKPRWGHSASVVDGKIYIMGGCLAAGGPGEKSIEVIDPVSGATTQAGEMTVGRVGHSAAVYKGKIYIFSGELEEPSLTNIRDVDVYDPSDQSWESLAPILTPRQFAASAVVKDTIYVIGGGSKYPYSGRKLIEAYYPETDSWKRKADLKIGILEHGICVIDDKIYCVGGSYIWGDSGHGKVQIYDPELDSVYMATDLQFARYGLACTAINGRICVSTGINSPSPDFETLSSQTEIGIPDF